MKFSFLVPIEELNGSRRIHARRFRVGSVNLLDHAGEIPRLNSYEVLGKQEQFDCTWHVRPTVRCTNPILLDQMLADLDYLNFDWIEASDMPVIVPEK